MDPAHDIAESASCTTCTFSEDFSNYWTAVLYFRAQNGTFKRVQQLPNQNLGGAQGGMTVYYISPDDRNVSITAFRPVSLLYMTEERNINHFRVSACSPEQLKGAHLILLHS